MEFIKLEFLDHHKDSLDSGAKKKQKSQVQTFRREQKIKKNRFFQILNSHWSDDFGFWKF